MGKQTVVDARRERHFGARFKAIVIFSCMTDLIEFQIAVHAHVVGGGDDGAASELLLFYNSHTVHVRRRVRGGGGGEEVHVTESRVKTLRFLIVGTISIKVDISCTKFTSRRRASRSKAV